jgi:hypothetical protein
MVQLVLIFCLAASSNSCKTVHPPFQEPYASLMGCMTQAQFIASEELRNRLDLQGYKLARWRCESGRQPGQSM